MTEQGKAPAAEPWPTVEEWARAWVEDCYLCEHGERNEFRHNYECEVCTAEWLREARSEAITRALEERGTLLWAVRQAVAALMRAADAMETRGAFLLEARAARDTLAWLDGHDGLQIALRAADRAASQSEPAAGRPSPEIPAIPDSKG